MSMKVIPSKSSGMSKAPRGAFGDPFRIDTIRHVNALIDEVLQSFEVSRQRCLVVGQVLHELKQLIPHGEFENYVERNFVRLPFRTAQRWMSAAQNIVKFLPPPDALDIDVSVLLTTDNAQLSGPEQKYKQLLLDLNNNTTLKDAANGVFVEGDEAHRIDRAVNGKSKGGKGTVDRKDFPLFIGRKLSDLGTHFSHYPKFSAAQLERTDVLVKQNVAKWPSPVLELIKKYVGEELKTR